MIRMDRTATILGFYLLILVVAEGQIPAHDSLSRFRLTADSLFLAGSYSEALNIRLKELDHIEKYGDPALMPETLFEIGRTHYFIRTQQSNETSLKFLEQALRKQWNLETRAPCTAVTGALGLFWVSTIKMKTGTRWIVRSIT